MFSLGSIGLNTSHPRHILYLVAAEYIVPDKTLKDDSRPFVFAKCRLGAEMSKCIVKGIGIGFLSCIGIGIAKTIFQVLVLVLLRGHPKYWYWYC